MLIGSVSRRPPQDPQSLHHLAGLHCPNEDGSSGAKEFYGFEQIFCGPAVNPTKGQSNMEANQSSIKVASVQIFPFPPQIIFSSLNAWEINPRVLVQSKPPP